MHRNILISYEGKNTAKVVHKMHNPGASQFYLISCGVHSFFLYLIYVLSIFISPASLLNMTTGTDILVQSFRLKHPR